MPFKETVTLDKRDSVRQKQYKNSVPIQAFLCICNGWIYLLMLFLFGKYQIR